VEKQRSGTEPEGGVGEGKLKFAAVFPKKEWKILPANQTESGGKKLLDGRKGILQPS
jgi:hypothetical protein